MSSQPGRELTQVLEKIPFFKGLSADQLREVLSISASGFYQPGDEIWMGGDAPGDEMYVLLAGELVVTTADGRRVATIRPVATIGELGLITQQRRSVAMAATQPSNVLVIPKPSFDQLLQDNQDIQVKIYRNVIDILVAKLVNDNVRKRDHLLDKARQERSIEEQRRRAEIAMNLAEKQGQISRAEVESYTVDQMQKVVRRILVVDDEPEIRHFVKNVLSDFEIVEAGTGKEALLKVQEARPDLVIADIKMPDMDGFTLLNHLRNQYPDLPVLALSGYVGAEEIQYYAFDGFIAKPIRVDEIKKVVEEALFSDNPAP